MGRCFYSDVAPALRTRSVNDNNDFIIEPIGCAMRGRNPENPSERGRSNGKYKQRIEMGSNISNTITSVQKDSLVVEPICINSKVDGKQPSLADRIYDVEGVSTCVTTSFHPNIAEPQILTVGYLNEGKHQQDFVQHEDGISRAICCGTHGSGPHLTKTMVKPLRIRKLTPRECFRLMGVSETNIDKIQQRGVSQSQQYKMAGNSIVVDVLEHIFRKMFIETGQESQQLSLF